MKQPCIKCNDDDISPKIGIAANQGEPLTDNSDNQSEGYTGKNICEYTVDEPNGLQPSNLEAVFRKYFGNSLELQNVKGRVFCF